jgi:hypothetical protein
MRTGMRTGGLSSSGGSKSAPVEGCEGRRTVTRRAHRLASRGALGAGANGGLVGREEHKGPWQGVAGVGGGCESTPVMIGAGLFFPGLPICT